MKKVVTILALLAMVSTASATVRVFVTTSSDGYGLETPANHAIPTISTVYANDAYSNAYDYADYYLTVPGPIRPGPFPPGNSPSGTIANPVGLVPDLPNPDFAYIWLQFQNEPKGSKIVGLTVEIREAGSTVPATDVATTYYVCNNLNTQLAVRRWNGTATPTGYPEWHNNPQTMVNVTAYGLQNLGTAALWNLWDPTNRIALLGAIENNLTNKIYEINITNIQYAVEPNPSVAGGVFQMPEPASLLLLGLAGLLIRRR
jgi:hypothetical protein